MRERSESVPNNLEYHSEPSDPKMIRNVCKQIFGENITPEQFAQELSLPISNIKAKMFPDYPHATEFTNHRFLTLRLDLVSLADQVIGHVTLAFQKNADDEPFLFIEERRLHETGHGLGLDLECQLENFCRNHNIWTIKNSPTSEPQVGQIGAYVWARYGYEFEFPDGADILRKTLIDYAQMSGITVENIDQLERPIDFARAQGYDEKGEIVPIGKNLLTKTNTQWYGCRELAMESQGTKDFINYLRERGREDLIKKYYS
ncbi:MAG: hypothetical protein A2445_00675 [Candidatus Jacksonbacteria bacterium RIFOXYC2_FULL_44_29]|nr:MAG: hypothetical protein UW45_C0010G0008 [Parcubacteria group bacterium GW2011_GWC2_44_22]OGY76070.1 MAG: hypothetical protein A2295_03890 [Candidatus Jacksonbacteria bacterium RIFOXYB2_FULL_44_15]OGY76373.1 MAG: hypothetical protein A2240_04405 [Candidatus Jacksonbacteria bacterium RIFOXYA2_FULL_43_12]OGY78011.1 MAG: hypothetical protein A2445_00675 [Candidatus Jacksonbacteria bacterium RIFOXYC2_FULL_44_29]OGY80317.1 MAG: hypothetical protein A2550_04410 [Candidatus Jacksonbacteria bacteri